MRTREISPRLSQGHTQGPAFALAAPCADLGHGRFRKAHDSAVLPVGYPKGWVAAQR